MKLAVKMDTAAIKWLGDLKGNLPRTLGRGVGNVLKEATRQVGLQIKPGAALHPRSGSLGKAFTPRGGAIVDIRLGVAKADGSLTANHPAARIQDEGGTVRPTRAKNLAIPLDAAKTAAGVPRWKSPREVAGLKFTMRGGVGFLAKVVTPARKVGAYIKGGQMRNAKRYIAEKLKFLFVLKSEATVPASHYLTKATTETEKLSGEIINAEVLKEIVNRKGIA